MTNATAPKKRRPFHNTLASAAGVFLTVTLIAFGLNNPHPVRAQDQNQNQGTPPDTKDKAKSQDVNKSQTQKPATPKRKTTAKKDDDHDHDHHKHTYENNSFMGRQIADVMSFLGASWLLRETRVKEEEPEKMLDSLEIQPGMTVADVGAGVGYHSLLMAKRVGPKGKVLATDVQPQMIRMLKQSIQRTKTKNVEAILCTPTETKLPEGAVDLILMVDVYHECSDPITTLEGLRKALKPGGRLVLVEFRGEDPDVPIKAEHKMTLAQVRKEVEPRGFTFLKVHDFLPWQHIIIFQKPLQEPPAPK